MKIIRGTFRLSIVIALLAAAYFGISAHVEANNDAWETRKMWTTLRCGERFLGQDMSRYASPIRSEVIDIGRAGCSESSFLATFDEIRAALATADPSENRYKEVFWPKLYSAMLNAFSVLVVLNLAGFLFLGARGVFR